MLRYKKWISNPKHPENINSNDTCIKHYISTTDYQLNKIAEGG